VEREFADINIDTFNSLITNNKIKGQIELILSEYEYEKYTSLRVPSNLTIDNMNDLLIVKDSTDRKKMFDFLYQKEFARLKTIRKRKESSEKYWSEKSLVYSKSNAERTGIWDNDHNLIYGLWHNSLFSKINRVSINRFYTNRLRLAAMFGHKLVIDLDYDKYMKLAECRLLAKQLQLLYNYNKFKTIEPFDLHFTNCNTSLPTMQAIPRFLTNYQSTNFMAPFHSQSYLDLFPKDQLVYLTPAAKEPLHALNLDHIYIMGGFIDKSFRDPVSYIKAKKEGIRTARLPIDEHVVWGVGHKHLCLNHIIAILHDVQMHGDWRKSLCLHLPQRNQKKIQLIQYEDEIRLQNLRRQNRPKFDVKSLF